MNIENFKNYLQAQGYATRTVKIYSSSAEMFTDWATGKGIQIKYIRYEDLLQFVRYCQQQGQSYDRSRHHIMALKHLFAMLVKQKQIRQNPVRQLHLKGRGRRLPHGLLEYEVLEQLYQDYQQHYPQATLRMLMLSLMIFQALRIEELQMLFVRHLKLKEGKIFIPGTRQSNSRMLPLIPSQIVALHEWTYDKQPNDLLLPSPWNTANLRQSAYKLYKEVRKLNREVRDGKQIRASTITYWLIHHDVRIVQHMAGHKWVSSTERYQQSSLEDLKKELDKYHPLQ